MDCTSKYPIHHSAVMKAKAAGFCRSTADQRMKEQLPVFDHKPMLQNIMCAAVKMYRSPCWVTGMCDTMKRKHLHQTFHRILMKRLKEHMEKKAEGTVATGKDVLTSGDLAFAIRFPASGSSSTPTAVPSGNGGAASSSSSSSSICPPSSAVVCRLYSAPKVSLRPEGCVLIAMDSNDKAGVPCQATLRKNNQSGFEFCTSLELCADLLSNHTPGDGQSVWLSVLDYKPVYLDKTFLNHIYYLLLFIVVYCRIDCAAAFF